MKRFTVACAGLGNRGKIHLKSLLANSDRFEVVAVCDINPEALQQGAEIAGLGEDRRYTDAEQMLADIRPDVFCFITKPDVRLPLAQLAAKYKVKGLILEKPMATSIQEAREIVALCHENGIKCAVSHQQKYLESLAALGEVVQSGVLGKIERIHAETLAWYSQLGTHFIDYALWAAGGARGAWCVGHAHGREHLTNVHPSPDFLYGLAGLDNGVRLFLECGYLKEPKIKAEGKFWVDNRLTVCGANGYVYAETDGAFGVQADGKPLETRQYRTWDQQSNFDVQIPFARDFADWLNGTAADHSCNADISLHGFEILQAMCVSALEHRRVDLPLQEAELYNVLAPMDKNLPEQDTYKARGYTQ
jgi:predicted dehydrogenase